MYWDSISGVYDLFETIYNRKVFCNTGKVVAGYISESDTVLECACGTGAITKEIAKKARKVLATDFSEGMLKQAASNCRKYSNVTVRKANITKLKIKDDRFDKVVAGNVIHLLDDPKEALSELERVCKPGGKVIIPTYINMCKKENMFIVNLINKMGANFKTQFDLDSYKKFFTDMGYEDVEFNVVDGKMPCAIAVITKS